MGKRLANACGAGSSTWTRPRTIGTCQPSRVWIVLGLCGLTVALACEQPGRAATVIKIAESRVTAGTPCALLKVPAHTLQKIEIDDEIEAPCDVAAIKTTVLFSSEDGSRPDPSWTSVARDSRGFLYTAATLATGPGTILVWGSDGSFVKSLGRPGRGPGELSPGSLLGVFVGTRDSIFIREAGRWSVFSPGHDFARVITGSAIQGRPRHTHLLGNGQFVVSGPIYDGDEKAQFHIADAEGNWTRSFRDALVQRGGRGAEMPIAVGAGSFWTILLDTLRNGYSLEEWTADGRLVRSIHRRARWLEYEPPRARDRGLPHFESINTDELGRIWVVTLVKDPRWRRLRQGEHEDEIQSRLYDIRYEVIDPITGRVLVSGLIDELPGEDERDVPPVLLSLPGTSISYRPAADSIGAYSIEFFELVLVERENKARQ